MSPSTSHKKIFVIISVGIILSLVGQFIMLVRSLSKDIVTTLPIQWYVWLILIVGSGWILCFGVIYFERNKKARIAFAILGLCALLVYVNVWLLMGLPILWTISLVVSIVMLSFAWHIYRRALVENGNK